MGVSGDSWTTSKSGLVGEGEWLCLSALLKEVVRLGSKRFWWLEELWMLETLRLGKVPDVLLGQERTILFRDLGWLLLPLVDDMHLRA